MSAVWPTEQELRDRLRALLGPAAAARPPAVAEWHGTGFRLAGRKFASPPDFVSGAGARINGGRFTPRGGPAAVYLALDELTAVAELTAARLYYGLPPAAFKPVVLAAVNVAVELALDLAAAGPGLGLTVARLHADWRADNDAGRVAPTQAFGRAVAEAGFEAALFPSARRPGGVNLVVFPDNLLPDSTLWMHDDD